jgi:hypothetical protein
MHFFPHTLAVGEPPLSRPCRRAGARNLPFLHEPGHWAAEIGMSAFMESIESCRNRPVPIRRPTPGSDRVSRQTRGPIEFV